MFTNESIKNYNALDHQIYDYVIQNTQKVSKMKIRELADILHVSTTSILRFCKKNNCEGFTDFKFQLREYQGSAMSSIESDSAEFIDFFNRIQSDYFVNNLKDIAREIAKHHKIIFIGYGSSGIIANYAARYLSVLGVFSFSSNDPYLPVYSIEDGYVVVALSTSGETKELIQIMNEFKRFKCPILSITNSANSTLSKISDYNISYYFGLDRREDIDLTSSIPVMAIVELLAKEIVKQIR